MKHGLCALALAFVLTGCTLGAGLVAKAPVAENQITRAAITTTTLAPAAAPAPVEAPLPPEALACLKKRDKWLPSGRGTAMICTHFTADAGKFCRKASDCEGYCLARSNTCAPMTPMLGCTEILQADGAKVTLCID